MFSLTVMLGSGQFRLMYKTEEAAVAAFAAVSSAALPMNAGNFQLRDDFGQQLEGKHASIHGHLLEDLDQSKLAAIELMLNNARIQNGAMKQAQSDPALRVGVAHSQTPILTPMGNGRFQG